MMRLPARGLGEFGYWTVRQPSARVVEPRGDSTTVFFGVRMTMNFSDGTKQDFREEQPPCLYRPR